jgi:hypothetical protein
MKAKIYKRIKERAKKQGLAVELTVEDITISSYCPILGIPLHVNYRYVRW